ncbi:alginate export family protein [Xanthovirga aplysinae]|uniref:alginate export family protein n=1 Tax=Xanthovirga aplysinae TaxID=2529853 RepID=UPI0012BCD9E2|nr:alginate export family protein [Xanthovirga aplysinae]MTI32184.1 hypothetical protein [Xanthovirga aplysinae]
MKKPLLLIIVIIQFLPPLFAQEVEEKKKNRKAFSMLRAEENYRFLGDEALEEQEFWDPIKFIPFNTSKSIYLTLGGEFRPRFEYFKNNLWGEAENSDIAFYSQRLAAHASLSVSHYLRFYGELYHGMLSKTEKEYTQDDALDLFQGFVEFKFPIKEQNLLSLRLGRQELSFGSSRLVGIREGPNLRRSFDAGRLIYSTNKIRVEGFLASEVHVNPEEGAFNNRRNEDMEFAGIYGRVDHNGKIPGHTEIYFYHFNIEQAAFSDAEGKENRQTIGLRRWGQIGRSFVFNTELMYQMGSLEDKSINAWALELDYHWLIHNRRNLKSLGLKLDYVSGDRNAGDNQLQTFNPLFNNPAYFGLLGNLAPMNLIDIHPSVLWEFNENIEFILDWDIYWRASKEDGLYAPPRFLSREGQEAQARFIGHQAGFELSYAINRHLNWKTEVSYFMTGDFIKETGEHKNIFHLATTFSYKF